ncbi:MAG: sigma-70 family RNA polymerase sigma factor [Myxococcaceae bacterium]|nr:sigma-70 family RNA polymerase sigma factor [Myxococcaceae bacterium]
MALGVGELFERYHGVVYRRCLGLLRNEADAAEAVQEVFVAALAGFGRFRLHAAPLTWLYAIATRHCLQHLRNRSTRELKHALFADAADVAPDLVSRADLERVLGALSLEELELVTHAFRDGLTQDEISAVTRQSRKTVGKKLKRLTDKLQLSLAPVEVPARIAG